MNITPVSSTHPEAPSVLTEAPPYQRMTRAEILTALRERALGNDRPELAMAALRIEDDDGRDTEHAVVVLVDALRAVRAAAKSETESLADQRTITAPLATLCARSIGGIYTLAVGLCDEIERVCAVEELTHEATSPWTP